MRPLELPHGAEPVFGVDRALHERSVRLFIGAVQAMRVGQGENFDQFGC